MKARTAFLILLFSVSARLQAAPPPEIQKKVDDCLKANDATACADAASALSSDSRISDKELAMKLLKKGCGLNDNRSCHALASSLWLSGDPAKITEAMAMDRKLCSNGYKRGCVDLGYLLKQRGENVEARDIYAKLCAQSPDFGGCQDAGELSSASQKEELKKQCDQKMNWACVAFAHAELKAGNTDAAKAIFLDRCKNKASMEEAWATCEQAQNLIKLPPDAKDFVEKQEMCTHWGGEEPYDEERAADIERGIQRDCIDRSAEYNALTKKYANQSEIMFVLERHKNPMD